MSESRSIDSVLQFDDQRLRQRSEPVDMSNAKELEIIVQNWIPRMRASMEKYGGIGIAAPQIGIFKRLVAIQIPNYERVVRRNRKK